MQHPSAPIPKHLRHPIGKFGILIFVASPDAKQEKHMQVKLRLMVKGDSLS